MSLLHNERCESKILLTGVDKSILEQYVYSIPYSIKNSFNDRFVNSIYYDTLNYNAFNDNLSGVSNRYKTRLRWYNNINNSKNFFLEFKIKQGAIGTKHIITLDLNLDLSSIRHSEIVHNVSNLLNSNDNILFNYCSHNPVVLVRYERSYYESITYNIRVTIDHKIKYYPQQYSVRLNNTLFSRTYNYIILELKYNSSDSELISDIVQYLPYRVTKSSKYVLGVDSILIK